jgi:hypothetical protein
MILPINQVDIICNLNRLLAVRTDAVSVARVSALSQFAVND